MARSWRIRLCLLPPTDHPRARAPPLQAGRRVVVVVVVAGQEWQLRKCVVLYFLPRDLRRDAGAGCSP